MKIDTLPIGLYEENIYILHDNGHVAIIDPGRYPKEIEKCIAKDETVDAVLLTHGHEDHVGAADDIAEYYDCPIYLHSGDHGMVDPAHKPNPYESVLYSKPKDLPEGIIHLGNFKFTVYHTPGHTKGSVLIQYKNVIFSGDTLFAASIGRTDLPGGDDEEMISSLQYILTLPKDFAVYPGHGPSTTIGNEIRVNPYLIYFTRDE